ncbi:thyrotroph embryonic factor isoform X3 [Mesoplodon densirostris]|uniref:thyrotroph embryonic factor isoform X3 n=1 Tax=Mesoplodon densirostris TaxID=48708 RepID=UPI0028DB4FAD|nr:thyrotroph embryonic factor isoform X3 [Mesoplodon densirostris]
MSDAGGGKKPPVEPQAGPGPGPGRAAGERGLPGSFPLVLKKLMENPPREARLDKEKGKEKLEEDEAAAASTMAVSASLMPPIWDKTIPYDGESFHLEYMDLDEFLLENGIPASPTHLAQNLLLPVAELEGKESASSSTASPPSSSTAVFQPSETVSSTGEETEKSGNSLKVTQLVGGGGNIEPRMFGCLARYCSGTGMKKAFLLPGQIASLGFLPHPLVLFLFYLWRSVGWFSCPWVTNPPEEAWPLF